jgi:hypothetical protein
VLHLTIGITGHRDLVEAEIPVLRKAVREFFSEIQKQFPRLGLQLISPLAEGADRLVAEVAGEMGISLVVPLPLPQELYEREFSSEESVRTFRAQLENAEVIEVPLADGVTAASLPENLTDRERQYAQLGIFISNHSQILLALWDGRPGENTGGTGQVVDYHVTAVMPGITDEADSPNLLADNENDLVFHIACSRQSGDGLPADGLKPFQTSWIVTHFERAPPDCIPADHLEMFRRLEDFSDDWQKYSQKIGSDSSPLLREPQDAAVPQGADYIDDLFRGADWLAIHFRKRVSLGLVGIHVLAVVMGLVFILYSELNGPVSLVWLFLVLYIVGLGLFQVGSRRHWHRKYLDYRALAEGLRVQLYWDLAGVSEPRSALFAYDNFLQKQDVDLGWIRHVMRSASIRSDRSQRPADDWVEWVISRWVGRAVEGGGQLGYYRNKEIEKTQNYRRTARLGSLGLWAGILIAVILAVGSGKIAPEQRDVLLVFMGVFPLMAGVRDAYSHKKAEKELIKQYRFMARVFANADHLLSGSGDIRFKRRVLRALGNAALEEHAEWILMHRERPLEQSGFT